MINHEKKRKIRKSQSIISEWLLRGELYFYVSAWAEGFSSAAGMVVSYFIQMHISFAIS